MPPIPQKKTATPEKPRMHNRFSGVTKRPGSSGFSNTQSLGLPLESVPRNKFRIAPALLPMVVPIDSLVLDPENARVHGDRNLEAIKMSLLEFGQVKPVVVRKANNVVVAGNGTLQCARELGWQDIAACIVEMTELEAAGYGLADNRTAELASWDFAMVARLDAKLDGAGMPTIGFNSDELEVLRAADWTPPPIADGPMPGQDGDPLMMSFTPDEYVPVGRALSRVGWSVDNDEVTQSQALSIICAEWLKYKEAENAANSPEEA